jgi:hypothetical protein
MKQIFVNLKTPGKIVVGLLVIGLIWGGKMAYNKLFPPKLKEVTVKTKAIGLPPLKYDVNANAPFKNLPLFNETVDIQSPEVRGNVMGWNALSP